MMKKSIIYFLLIFVLLTSVACSIPFLAGSSSDPEPAEESTMEIPTSAVPTAALPTPDEVSEGVDSCLVGVWTMDTYALNNKFLDLTHSPNMYVVAPSAMTMELRADGRYMINGETIVKADIPSGSDFMQISGVHSGEGRYSADGSYLLLSDSTYAVDFGTIIISIDGETTEGPFSAIPLPEDFMSPPSATTYVCSTNTLLVTYEGPSGSITEEWTR